MTKEPASIAEREQDKLNRLNALLGPDQSIETAEDLQKIPVTRKDQVLKAQVANPPFGGERPKNLSHIFQSPGPIYEPCLAGGDYWRFGRFLEAIGMGGEDTVLNTFAYHFTPAGAMFESAARSVGAVVVPTGPGNTSQQAEVAAATGVTAYAGTPDFLDIILERGAEAGLDLSRIKHAAVSAGPLFPQLRQAYADKGIICRQCYGTADVGLISYETASSFDGMVVDDDIIIEIVSPGTGKPVPDGEIGEVVVTVLNPDHLILRFSVGDLSAIATNPVDAATGDPSRLRIVGWRGRADQATKVRGMFIRPEQVSTILERCPDVGRARVEVSLDGSSDRIAVKLESETGTAEALSPVVQDVLKLRAEVTVVPVGTLPRDGILVADLRDHSG